MAVDVIKKKLINKEKITVLDSDENEFLIVPFDIGGNPTYRLVRTDNTVNPKVIRCWENDIFERISKHYVLD